MTRFSVTPGTFGSFETLVLRDSHSGAEAVMASRGATLLSWQAPVEGQPFELTGGFATPGDFETGEGGRAAIMAPWSNRIEAGTYEWDGRAYKLPINNTESHSAIHGLVRFEDFEASTEVEDDDRATALFVCQAVRADAHEGYPFDVDIHVRVTLRADELELEIGAANVGQADAPFGCGWHPYFRVGEGSVDDWVLTVPARQKIAVDENLIPLPGEAAYVEIADGDDRDFRTGDRVGDRVIDCAFNDLARDDEGWLTTTLRNPDTGTTVLVGQDRGLMHVYTGDRTSLALEPVELMTNAFNRPECRDALRLAPGQKRLFRMHCLVRQT
jgi:aldose 1-epimerase